MLDFVKFKLQVKRGGEQRERMNGRSAKKRGEKMKIKGEENRPLTYEQMHVEGL